MTGGTDRPLFRFGRIGMRRDVFSIAVLATLLFGLFGVPPVGAAGGCQQTASPTGAYTVNVCLTPASGVVTGTTVVAATVTVTGTSPVVGQVVFYLDGQYVLTDYQRPYTFELVSNRFVDGIRSLSAVANMRDGFASSPATAALQFQNGVFAPPVNTRSFTPSTGRPAAPGAPFVVAAVGDGGSGEVNSNRVSDQLVGWNPSLLLYLGDVYEKGSPMEFHNWYGPEGKLFGRLRSITNPVVGNHEYEANAAPGYFDYWDNIPNYYSYDAGGWHFIALNSNSSFGETDPASGQYRWLERDLARNAGECTIVYFHHPVYSVGPEGSTDRMSQIWKLLARWNVELVLAAHDHNYQRWRPLGFNGNLANPGTTQFVVGTGGHGMRAFIRSDFRMVKGFDTTSAFGALRLELFKTRADYRFSTTAGTTLDSGSINCLPKSIDSTPPTAPTNLTATAVGPYRVNLAWSASTDNVNVTGYDIFRDGEAIDSDVLGTSYADVTVLPETTYRYEVRARDASSNLSGFSNAATVTTGSAVPPLFEDGFESGSLSAWAGVTGLTVGQTEVATGAWAARATSTGAATWAYRQLAANEPEVYYRIRFKILSQAANTVYLLRFRGATGTSLLGVYLGSSGRLSYRNDISARSITSSLTVSRGFWHTLQVRLKINGAASELETWLDGTRINELSRIETYGSETIGRVQIGENATARTYDIAFDDVIVGRTAIPDAPPPPPADSTPPTLPTSLSAAGSGPSRVNLSWTASTDDTGVTGYDVFRDGASIATNVPATTLADTTVSPETTYRYEVRARDAANNLSGFSNSATVTTGSATPLLFEDGFESGNLSNWSGVTGLTVGQAEVASGAWAARATSTGTATWAYRPLAASEQEVYYRIRFKTLSQGANTVYLLRFRSLTGTSLLGVYLSSTGRLSYRNDVAALGTSSSLTVSQGAWHSLQVRLKMNGAASELETWLDGVRVSELSRTETYGGETIGRLQIGENATGRTYDIAFDDIAAGRSALP